MNEIIENESITWLNSIYSDYSEKFNKLFQAYELLEEAKILEQEIKA